MVSKKAIRRLRLRDGDIVVVKDDETMQALKELRAPKGTPNCQIIFAPNGIKRLSREYLLKLLNRES